MPAQTALPMLRLKKGATFITDIQSFTISAGKRKISDTFRSTTAIISGRRPDLLPSIAIGDVLQVFVTVTSGATLFNYTLFLRVADLRIVYGTTSALDTWELSLEDTIAYLGRATLPTRTIAAGTNAGTAAVTIAADVGVTLVETGTTTAVTSAQTVTGQNALEVLNNLANTEYAWLESGGGSDLLGWLSRQFWTSGTNSAVFADDGTGDIEYESLTFDSLADNYANKVVVSPVGGTDVEVGTGDYSFTVNTYSQDSIDATNLGEFITGVFNVSEPSPSSISYLVNTQDATTWTKGLAGPSFLTAIKFRSQFFYARQIGYVISGNTSQTRITTFLLPYDGISWLVLDDPVLGKLDSNKLGW